MIFYIYICLLVIAFIMIVQGLVWIKFLPAKVKIITFFILMAMMLRYMSIIILFLNDDMKYLYMLKIPFFLNLIAIPLMAFTVMYIFMRKDNIKFYYIFIISVLLCGLYVFVIYNYGAVLENIRLYSLVWGYSLTLPKDSYIYWTYIMFNTLVIFFALAFMGKNNPNKFGIYLMMLAAGITSAEVITWLLGIKILAQTILGDISWITVLIYALNKVRKNHYPDVRI